MVKIPVVVVDDDKTDRYIARRVLSRHEEFDEVMEAPTGQVFLEEYFNGSGSVDLDGRTLLVLMDINMPRMNGFETIEELERRMDEGRGPERVAVLMFTSSNSPEDRARAEALRSVKGYVVKPLDGEAAQTMVNAYYSH